jgi:uncharacterized protein YjbI with pentapeptide repeats
MLTVPAGQLILMLAAGVECWNAFRRQNPGCVMLNGSSLAEACLAGADLRRAFLMGSDLHGADLRSALLECAILRKSNLRGSDLRGAQMNGADLFRADLSGADLRDSSLGSAFLKRADLRGTDLSTAVGLTETQLVEARGDLQTKLPANLTRPDSWRS